jgi:hypothetical protein
VAERSTTGKLDHEGSGSGEGASDSASTAAAMRMASNPESFKVGIESISLIFLEMGGAKPRQTQRTGTPAGQALHNASPVSKNQ